MKQLLTLVVALSMSTCLAAEDLAGYRNVYERESARIENAREEELNRLHCAYEKSLVAIKASRQKAGDLAGVLACWEEEKRFKKEKTVPAESSPDLPQRIRKVRSSFLQSAADAEVKKAKKLKALNESYVRRLTALKKELVTQGKIEDAVTIDTEIKRMEILAAIAEAEMPKPKPSPVTPESPPKSRVPRESRSDPGTLTQGLLRHYSFDGDLGDTAIDRGPLAMHGRTYRARSVLSGRVGKACEFANPTAYIDAGACPLTTGQASMCIWIKTTVDRDTTSGIADINTSRNGGGFCLALRTRNGKVSITWHDTPKRPKAFPYVTSRTVVADGRWHFVAATYDSRGTKLYVDGRLEASKTRSSRLRNLGQFLHIGKLGNQTRGYRLEGCVDELRVYDRALSSLEVRSLYNETTER